MRVGLSIGAAFGGEDGAFEADLPAEAADQIVEDVVVLVEQAARLDLQRDVAVAEVVGEAGEEEGVVRTRDTQGFERRAHADAAAVLRFELVPLGERGAARQEHADLLAARETPAKAVPAARVPIEHELVRRGRARGRADVARAQHVRRGSSAG
jgi:hypothetical protein